jgi:hypothetical protein
MSEHENYFRKWNIRRNGSYREYERGKQYAWLWAIPTTAAFLAALARWVGV